MSIYSLNPFKCILTIILLSAAALLFGGCKARELPFETIEKVELGDVSRQYEGIDPKLVVLTSASEARAFDRGVSSRAQTALEALDYEHYFAIAVLRGRKGTTGYSVQIESLTLKDDTITIRARFSEPKKGEVEVVVDVVTSSYHLVSVPLEGLHGALEFVLEVDGEVLESETHSFP